MGKEIWVHLSLLPCSLLLASPGGLAIDRNFPDHLQGLDIGVVCTIANDEVFDDRPFQKYSKSRLGNGSARLILVWAPGGQSTTLCASNAHRLFVQTIRER